MILLGTLRVFHGPAGVFFEDVFGLVVIVSDILVWMMVVGCCCVFLVLPLCVRWQWIAIVSD